MITKETVLSNIKKNTFPKRHYSPARIETISKSYLPQLVYWMDSGAIFYEYGAFRLTDDPQVSVYENMAWDNYTKVSYPPVVFLRHFFGLSFSAALYLLNHFYYNVEKAPLCSALEDLKGAGSGSWAKPKAAAKGTDLGYILLEDRLAQGDSNALKRTYAYLVNTRGLNRNLVENLIKQGYVKMDNNSNLCFVTYADPLDKRSVTAVTVKGTTDKRFNQNLVAEPNTGFFYAAKPMLEANAYEEVFVFESVIDLMAYLSLLWEKRITEAEGHSANRCYIALNGLGNYDYLQRLLAGHLGSFKAVNLCLDNDQRGMEGAERFKAYLSMWTVNDFRESGLKPISAQFGYCKDWADVVRLPYPDLGMVG